MNKNLIMILVVVVVLLVAAGIWYFGFYNSSSSNINQASTNSNTNSATNTLPIKKTEAPILIFGITPNSGLLAGGETATIAGDNFVEGATVKFGENDAKQVTFVSSKELSVVVPASTVTASVDIRVQNPDKLTSILQQGYTYTEADTAESETEEQE